MNTIEMRLQNLETANSWYRKVIILMGLVFCIFFVMAFDKKEKPQEIIKAKGFEVVNDRGEVQASLRYSPLGGGLLSIDNAEGKNVIELYNNGNKGGFLGICDSNGEGRITLSTTNSGAGLMQLNNSSGHTIFSASQSEYGSGDIQINGSAGQEMIRMSIAHDGTSGSFFHMRNYAERIIVKMRTTNEDHGRISVYDSRGEFVQGIGYDY